MEPSMPTFILKSTENIRGVRCVLLQISVHHSLDFPESSAKLVYLSQSIRKNKENHKMKINVKYGKMLSSGI